MSDNDIQELRDRIQAFTERFVSWRVFAAAMTLVTVASGGLLTLIIDDAREQDKRLLELERWKSKMEEHSHENTLERLNRLMLPPRSHPR